MKLSPSVIFLLIAWSSPTINFNPEESTTFPNVTNPKEEKQLLIDNVKGYYSLPSNSSSFEKLSQLPVINETGIPIKHVILVSHHRSGSTFTGYLLQENWKTWYTYEPFFELEGIDTARSKYNQSDYIEIIKGIHNCDYYSLEWYLEIMSIRSKTFMKFNRFRYSLCQSDLCFDPKFNHEACIRSEYRITKTVRLTLASVEKLLDQLNGSLDIRIVYLIRDPRAILNSRKGLEWCRANECANLRFLCESMKSDLESYKRLVQRYGDSIIGIRYEDLAINVLPLAKKLFNATGLPFNNGIAEFIQAHSTTNAHQSKDPRSIQRISKDVPLKWIKESLLSKSEVDDIQNHCSQAMEELGYKSIDFASNISFSYEDIMQPKVTRLPNFIQ